MGCILTGGGGGWGWEGSIPWISIQWYSTPQTDLRVQGGGGSSIELPFFVKYFIQRTSLLIVQLGTILGPLTVGHHTGGSIQVPPLYRCVPYSDSVPSMYSGHHAGASYSGARGLVHLLPSRRRTVVLY